MASNNIEYIATIAINLTGDCDKSRELILGTILVTNHDSYDTIVGNINKLLHKYYLTPIDGFHYVQEDGDVGYVNKSIVNRTDLYDAIKYNTTFYVYYDY